MLQSGRGRSDAATATVTLHARLTEIAASEECGAVHEIASPDDNLQAVFKFLVKP